MQYGLLGERLEHSYSPLIHGLLGDYEYALYPCAPGEFAKILQRRAFRGMNVTIPYKRMAFEMCDHLSQEAKALGNVNTLLVDEGGRLWGHNTDGHGFRAMVAQSGIRVRGKKAAVLGGGGSGRTAAYALREMGALEVIQVSRSGPVDYQALYREHRDVQVLVNATPVGMYPGNGQSPVELERLPGCQGVLDLIYNPYRTALMLDALERGIPCAGGLWMLIAQAHRAAELFTGGTVEPGRIPAIHQALRARMENIVLVGMPGSGKTSVGEALAARMGRAFVDLDQEFVRRQGMEIPAFFQERGEEEFRREESALCEEYGKQGGLVIATGGGAVLRPGNRRCLMQNGEIFYLERPLEELATQGRPLSAGGGALERMYTERLPLYRACSRATIENLGPVEQVAGAVEEEFYAVIGDQRPQP